LAEGKTVVLMTEPTTVRRLTPIGPLSDVAIQAELVNALSTNAFLRSAPRGWLWPVSFLLAALTAWLALAPRVSTALVGSVASLLGYGAALTLAPWLAGTVLPVLTPLVAMVAGGGGALLWGQVGATRRLRGLESEVGLIRDALVRQESTVEALEEDLEAARVAVARSTGTERELLQAAEALCGQLGEARAQEAQTRARLQTLEHELRAASSRPTTLADTELERLRRQCAEVGIVTRDPA